MAALLWLPGADRRLVDQCMMQALLLLSSSEPARRAAAAWLAALEAAQSSGATERAAHAEAERAWQVATQQPHSRPPPEPCTAAPAQRP